MLQLGEPTQELALPASDRHSVRLSASNYGAPVQVLRLKRILHQQDIKAWTGPEENDVSSKTFGLNGIRQNIWLESVWSYSPGPRTFPRFT